MNFKLIFDYLGATIECATKRKNAQIEAYNRQLESEYHFTAQLQLQGELYQVLKQTNISPRLARLTSAQDLLPCGYQRNMETTTYYYSWTKSSDDIIPVTMLSRYANKMNIAIGIAYKKFYGFLQQCEVGIQTEHIQLHPTLYNGFFVTECMDDGDSIILAVKFA